MKNLGLAVLTAGAMGVAAVSVSQANLPFNVPDRIATVEAQNPSGSAFNNALHREYLALGQEAYAEEDRLHARRYLRKGYNAGNNGNVQPENPRTWWVPDRSRGELYEWHGRLLTALESGRDNMPAVAARAQAMYDCWLEEEHEDVWMRAPGVDMYQPDDIARCKNAFLAAMCELEGRCRVEFTIHFRFDRPRPGSASRADLWPGGPERSGGPDVPAGAAALDEALSAAREATGQSIGVTGHTDAVGSEAYNLELGKRRAQFVVGELVGAGVERNNINASSFGESRLVVDTARREVQNRRVEVRIGQ
jgi:OOP family OmpA-OmpF porin